MSFQQTEYSGRLPYGLWVNPDAREEHLFDRGYHAIATRPLARPWRVTLHSKHRFIDAGPSRVQSYFYNGRTCPQSDADTSVLCERILARFCLGRDVRFWLLENEGNHLLPGMLKPKTGGKYLPESMNRRKMEFIIAADLAADQEEVDALLA